MRTIEEIEKEILKLKEEKKVIENEEKAKLENEKKERLEELKNAKLEYETLLKNYLKDYGCVSWNNSKIRQYPPTFFWDDWF